MLRQNTPLTTLASKPTLFSENKTVTAPASSDEKKRIENLRKMIGDDQHNFDPVIALRAKLGYPAIDSIYAKELIYSSSSWSERYKSFNLGFYHAYLALAYHQEKNPACVETLNKAKQYFLDCFHLGDPHKTETDYIVIHNPLYLADVLESLGNLCQNQRERERYYSQAVHYLLIAMGRIKERPYFWSHTSQYCLNRISELRKLKKTYISQNDHEKEQTKANDRERKYEICPVVYDQDKLNSFTWMSPSKKLTVLSDDTEVTLSTRHNNYTRLPFLYQLYIHNYHQHLEQLPAEKLKPLVTKLRFDLMKQAFITACYNFESEMSRMYWPEAIALGFSNEPAEMVLTNFKSLVAQTLETCTIDNLKLTEKAMQTFFEKIDTLEARYFRFLLMKELKYFYSLELTLEMDKVERDTLHLFANESLNDKNKEKYDLAAMQTIANAISPVPLSQNQDKLSDTALSSQSWYKKKRPSRLNLQAITTFRYK